MTDSTCSVENCPKPLKRMSLCYGHYMKQWRYGTPTPKFPPRWEDIRGKRYGTLTVRERQGRKWLCDCDCGETATRSAGELNRSGNASICGVEGRHLTAQNYSAAHRRVVNLHGPASDHRCHDCEAPAYHWSYDHLDPDEGHEHGLSANPIAYSKIGRAD